MNPVASEQTRCHHALAAEAAAAVQSQTDSAELMRYRHRCCLACWVADMNSNILVGHCTVFAFGIRKVCPFSPFLASTRTPLSVEDIPLLPAAKMNNCPSRLESCHLLDIASILDLGLSSRGTIQAAQNRVSRNQDPGSSSARVVSVALAFCRVLLPPQRRWRDVEIPSDEIHPPGLCCSCCQMENVAYKTETAEQLVTLFSVGYYQFFWSELI